MSNCIKDLYDYELVKKCCKCGIVKVKINFHKRFKFSDGFHPQCNFWMKECYVANKNRILNKWKFYNKENRDRIKEYQLENHYKIKN